MSLVFLLGFGTAIIAALLVYGVLALIRSRKGVPLRARCKFDERQIAARGLAFQSGFFTLLACNAGAACLEAAELPWFAHGIGYILSLIAGVAVFAVVSIHKDAYMGLNQNPGKWFAGFGVLLAVNLSCAAANLLIERDMNIFVGEINLAVSGLLLLVILAQAVHLMRSRREQEEE